MCARQLHFMCFSSVTLETKGEAQTDLRFEVRVHYSHAPVKP